MKKKIRSAPYAQREYGVTPKQLERFEKATERQYQKLKKAGKLITVSAKELKKLFE